MLKLRFSIIFFISLALIEATAVADKKPNIEIAAFDGYPIQTYTLKGKKEDLSLSKKDAFVNGTVPRVVGLNKRMQLVLIETADARQYFVHKRIIIPADRDDWNTFLRKSGARFYCLAEDGDDQVNLVLGTSSKQHSGTTKGLAKNPC